MKTATGISGSKRAGAEEELCLGEAHAITPVQCSTIPRAGEDQEPGQALRRGTDRGRRRNRLRDRVRGQKGRRLGLGRQRPARRRRKPKTAPRRCARCSNRPPRWSKSWAAPRTRWRGSRTANCTPGDPTGRASSASKPDRKPTNSAATTRAAWCPNPFPRSSTWWRSPPGKGPASPSRKKKARAR